MSSTSPVNALQPPQTPHPSAPPPAAPTAATTSPRTARSPLVSNNPPGSLINRSSAQLASMLADSFRENEQLKRELSLFKRNAEKYDRMVTLVQNSPPSTSSPSFPEALPPAAVKRIMEFEAKLERAEIEKDECQARIRIMQDIWGQLDQYLAQCEFRAKDAREGFNKILQDAGGQLQPLTKEQWNLHLPDIPFPNTVPFPSPTYLPVDRQPLPSMSTTSRPRHRKAPPPPSQGSLQMAPTMIINPNSNNNGTAISSFPLPPHPHPVGGSSRVRPRAGSMDTASYSSGGPPPMKKPRDAGYLDDTRHMSRSPIVQNAPPAHQPRQATSASIQPVALHPHQQQVRDEHSRRHRHQMDDGSPATRGHSPHRPSSRSSSTSLDEMLLEATSTNHENQQQLPSMFTYPQAQAQANHPTASQPPRSPSPHSHSPVNSRGVMFQGPTQGGSLHSYQTHIFAPPVTGAPPVKKSNTSTSMSNSLSRAGSVASGSAAHHGHHGAHVLGPGGYPPTNAQGQRICRQCGLVGRYKDGKCVEKWGPGPEGPGTVCDKCRKKMKRVERRGTIESQQQREQREQHQQVQQALAHHRSQQNIQVTGSSISGGGSENHVVPERTSSSSTPGLSVPRTDTVVVGPGINYDHQRITSAPSRHEDPRPSPIPSGNHGRGDVIKRPDALSTNGNGNGSGPLPSGRRPIPTPPYIATLPESNEIDEEDERQLGLRDRDRGHRRRDSGLLNGVGERDPGTPNGVSKPETVSAEGGDDDDQMNIDRDGDDADVDADCEEDAEADLLEAVDAAEEARKDKSCGESSRDDEPEDETIKMKIEEEL